MAEPETASQGPGSAVADARPPGAPPSGARPAFYARGGGPVGDWITLLHPPYTAWHLGYVGLGAALVPRLDWAVFWASLAGFALAVGVAAHALDEWKGRPLRTGISGEALWTAAVLSLAGACALGVGVLRHSGYALLPLIAVGVVLVLGYNLELFGGALHTDLGFALAWGAFPVLVGYVAQGPRWNLPGTCALLFAALAATAFSAAQRRLSTPARILRRRVAEVAGEIRFADGSTAALDRSTLLNPLDGALKLLSAVSPTVAAALLLYRWSAR
ncbi:hypothetical protein KDL01_35590 [Actinospica durhamensis]|uniref:Uncharacterized protein n=1 Tax=Actinospica durhamensis TaxID=1508375 RepID=A0A941IW66_9ACTN|nr:hypothetical protein [Actinospica durhamensis]MBR7838646.1 hypothetical protein [Actinospica durhamensis]